MNLRPARTRLAKPLLALLAFSMLSIPGCSPPTREDSPPGAVTAGPPVPGGTLVMGNIADADSWNEYLSRHSFTVGLLRRIYLPLAREHGETRHGPPTYEPVLADSWWYSDDHLELTFHLADVRWSDGRPITAADVVFTWKAQISPEVAWVGMHLKKYIIEVESVDASTVVFHFDRVYPEQFYDAVEGGILPAHVFGKVPLEQWRTHDWSTIRIGSGPFLLAHHSPGDEITLVRNPSRGTGETPWIERVVIRIVPDMGNLLTQFISGHIDYLEGVPPRDAGRAGSAEGATVIAYDHPKYDYIGWNGNREPFDDPEIRRALTMSIDRQALVEELLYGYGRVCAGPVPSFWWAADDTLSPWKYDPAAASEIFESRGYRRREEDGILEKDGKPFEFTMTTNAGNSLREAMLVKIQAHLRRVGVRIFIRPMQMRAWIEDNLSGNYDAYLGGWVLSGKVELGTLFGSSAIPPAGSNVVAYNSDAADRLLRSLEEARDYDSMKPVLIELQQQIHEDQPYTFLYEVQRLASVGSRLRNVHIDDPADSMAFIEDAWIVP